MYIYFKTENIREIAKRQLFRAGWNIREISDSPQPLAKYGIEVEPIEGRWYLDDIDPTAWGGLPVTRPHTP